MRIGGGGVSRGRRLVAVGVVALSALLLGCGGGGSPAPTGPPEAEIKQAYNSGYLYGFRLVRKDLQNRAQAKQECAVGAMDWPEGPERDEFQRGCEVGWKENR